MKILEKIESIKDGTNTRLEVVFYNLDNYRDDEQVSRELHAIASDEPDLIGLCEAIGNRLPPLPGYRVIKSNDHSGSPRGKARANIAIYVKSEHKVSDIEWIDCFNTWPRTQSSGTHEPRSYLRLRVEGIVVIVAHQPQRPLGDAALRGALWSARAEGIAKLAAHMSGKSGVTPRAALSRLRPHILMSDFNARVNEPQGPDILAAKIGGRVYNGDRIDNFVVRGAITLVGKVRVVSGFNGVILRSDHNHAIRATFKVSKVWMGLK